MEGEGCDAEILVREGLASSLPSHSVCIMVDGPVWQPVLQSGTGCVSRDAVGAFSTGTA